MTATVRGSLAARNDRPRAVSPRTAMNAAGEGVDAAVDAVRELQDVLEDRSRPLADVVAALLAVGCDVRDGGSARSSEFVVVAVAGDRPRLSLAREIVVSASGTRTPSAWRGIWQGPPGTAVTGAELVALLTRRSS